MSYAWQSEKTQLRKAIRTPAIKKLQWLEEVRQFISLLPRKTLAARNKLKKG